MVRNASESVIRISPKNPHYFSWRGKEILLLTSAEHYGAVVNKRFDYRAYIDTLARYGLNYTRIYPGAHIEVPGMFSATNILAPGADVIVPWARSDEPGYAGGGNKFDLDKWDAEYFKRLDDFLSYADKNGVIVEICFFNCMYENIYPYCPMNKDANIQGVGECTYLEYQTLADKKLVERQLAYVEKLIIETNKFDNVIYEFIDEPTLHGTKNDDTRPWIDALIERAVSAEDKLPKKHMLAQQLMAGLGFYDDDRLAVNVAQYIDFVCKQVGGRGALNSVYEFDKPIEVNETAYLPFWYECDKVAASRLEAWEFMVGGGAAFNQLNGYFHAGDAVGNDPVNYEVLNGLKLLREFLEGFDFVKMTRDTDVVMHIVPGGFVSAISERGRQYAIYIHHSFPNLGGYRYTYFTPNFGAYKPTITLNIEKGDYKLTFIDPKNLNVISETAITSDGSGMEMKCPEYELDIAVKIIRI